MKLPESLGPDPRDSSLRWLYLGVCALALAGLYSIILVLLRTPILSGLLSDPSLFRTTLVIHVNLSVFVWLLSSMAFLWCRDLDKKFDYWINYCSYLGLVGVVAMSAAPLVADSNPVLNNYIPMLENWCFIAGLVLFACASVGPAVINTCSNIILKGSIRRMATTSSAIILLIAYICFILSYFGLQQVPYPLDLHFYYEMVFWSFGHMLQLVYTQGVMIVWIILSGIRLPETNLYRFIFILNLLLTLPALYAHMVFPIDSTEFIEFFTLHMKYCGGIAPTLLLAAMVYNHHSYKHNDAFVASLILFFFGGMLGLLISGTNVTIPAHYHGSIVGISIAFMGFCYKELHIVSRWSRWQPWVYAIGQTMHIVGLAWSGGYGVLRKTPAGELSAAAKISMGFMGLGGLVAVIGGLIFVWICARRIFYKA